MFALNREHGCMYMHSCTYGCVRTKVHSFLHCSCMVMPFLRFPVWRTCFRILPLSRTCCIYDVYNAWCGSVQVSNSSFSRVQQVHGRMPVSYAELPFWLCNALPPHQHPIKEVRPWKTDRGGGGSTAYIRKQSTASIMLCLRSVNLETQLMCNTVLSCIQPMLS